MVSLDTTRDPIIHAHRRKVWDQAFSMKGKALISALKLRFYQFIDWSTESNANIL